MTRKTATFADPLLCFQSAPFSHRYPISLLTHDSLLRAPWARGKCLSSFMPASPRPPRHLCVQVARVAEDHAPCPCTTTCWLKHSRGLGVGSGPPAKRRLSFQNPRRKRLTRCPDSHAVVPVAARYRERERLQVYSEAPGRPVYSLLPCTATSNAPS